MDALSVPCEIWEHIFTFLDFETLQFKVSLTCKALLHLVRNFSWLAYHLNLKCGCAEEAYYFTIMEKWPKLRSLRQIIDNGQETKKKFDALHYVNIYGKHHPKILDKMIFKICQEDFPLKWLIQDQFVLGVTEFVIMPHEELQFPRKVHPLKIILDGQYNGRNIPNRVQHLNEAFVFKKTEALFIVLDAAPVRESFKDTYLTIMKSSQKSLKELFVSQTPGFPFCQFSQILNSALEFCPTLEKLQVSIHHSYDCNVCNFKDAIIDNLQNLRELHLRIRISPLEPWPGNLLSNIQEFYKIKSLQKIIINSPTVAFTWFVNNRIIIWVTRFIVKPREDLGNLKRVRSLQMGIEAQNLFCNDFLITLDQISDIFDFDELEELRLNVFFDSWHEDLEKLYAPIFKSKGLKSLVLEPFHICYFSKVFSHVLEYCPHIEKITLRGGHLKASMCNDCNYMNVVAKLKNLKELTFSPWNYASFQNFPCLSKASSVKTLKIDAHFFDPEYWECFSSFFPMLEYLLMSQIARVPERSGLLELLQDATEKFPKLKVLKWESQNEYEDRQAWKIYLDSIDDELKTCFQRFPPQTVIEIRIANREGVGIDVIRTWNM